MRMVAYCNKCNEDLTINADDAIACSCAVQLPGEPVPASWVTPEGCDPEPVEPVTAETLDNWREFRNG
jgi:hypothetical protein